MQRHNAGVVQRLVSEAPPSTSSVTLRAWSVEGEDVALDPNMKLSFKMRALEMWLFTAFLMHHTGATIIFTANCAGTLAAEIFLLGAIANGLQHAASFLNFFSKNLFLVLLLLCEVWMQLEFFHAMPVAEAWSQLGIWCLIVSHWMFLSEALCGMLVGHRDVNERLALGADDLGIHARRSTAVLGNDGPGDRARVKLSEETRPYSATAHKTSGPEEALAPTLVSDQPSEEGGQRRKSIRPSVSNSDRVPDHHISIV